MIDRVFVFEETKQALDYVESGRAKGKVVIKVRRQAQSGGAPRDRSSAPL
ncbi:MAG TPA: zinc-binding dehydrogenase [Steroidobacteraceae bacterium]|nr:zinc-binding dehydrogenase [Steroidobacteraceae bacterium]